MTTKFLITGLPRSRTAWLTVLFHHGKCWCEHELTAFDPDLMTLNHCEEFEAAGTCDSGALLMQPASFWGDYRVVVVERPSYAVCESLSKLIDVRPDHILTIRETLERMRATKALHVPFSDLDRYEVCNEIWRYIGNTTPLDIERFDRLKQFNIQRQHVGRRAGHESIRRLEKLLGELRA